jgi:hypothetical protein
MSGGCAERETVSGFDSRVVQIHKWKDGKLGIGIQK